MQSKLDRLKNAWNEYTMGLANNKLIKGAIDLLTKLLNTINKLTSGLSGKKGIFKSILDIGILIGGLKLAKAAFNGFFGWLTNGKFGKKFGENFGKDFSEGIEKNIDKLKSNITKLKSLFSKTTWVNTDALKGFDKYTEALKELSDGEAYNNVASSMNIFNE